MISSVRFCTGFVVAASLAVGSGCARTAHFTVVRPAMLNAAQVGNTMTVGPIVHNGHVQAAAEISADLSNRIAHSLNPSIRLVAGGGGVVITASILADDYGEQFERSDRTCTRQVENGRNGQGIVQYRTESYRCTDIRRIGTGVSRVEFAITHGQNGTVLFDQTYENTNRIVTTGIDSPYEHRDPDYIDGGLLVHNLRADSTDHFARVILPWQEVVSVDFEDCDGDARCRQGFDLVQHGQLEPADGLFTQVIANHQSPVVPVAPNEAERVGEAFYNRGVTREYLGHYAQAAADLSRAIQIRPNETSWPHELESVQRMSRDQEALRAQGAVSNETQNVRQAGTP